MSILSKSDPPAARLGDIHDAAVEPSLLTDDEPEDSGPAAVPSFAAGAAETEEMFRPGRRALEQVLERIKAHAESELEEPVQRELARWFAMLPDLKRNGDVLGFIQAFDIAVANLLQPRPNLVLARDVRRGIQQCIHRSPWTIMKSLLFSSAPASRVILGLATMLLVAAPVLLTAARIATGGYTVFGMNAQMLALVALAGLLGSVVSIMVRIRDFDVDGTTEATQDSVLFFTGFFKPVIGVAFAWFVYALISSQFISMTIPQPPADSYLFMALSFLAGFSERLARDVVVAAERAMPGRTDGPHEPR
jgi:hypothetical protein